MTPFAPVICSSLILSGDLALVTADEGGQTAALGVVILDSNHGILDNSENTDPVAPPAAAAPAPVDPVTPPDSRPGESLSFVYSLNAHVTAATPAQDDVQCDGNNLRGEESGEDDGDDGDDGDEDHDHDSDSEDSAGDNRDPAPHSANKQKSKKKSKITFKDLKKAADGRYMKPPSTVGRPGRGGYNIKDVLPWSHTRTDEIREEIKRIVASYLDHSLGMRAQPTERCKFVLEKVRL